MPALSFPPSPAVNDLFTASGKTWKWNGTFWELVVSGASVADGSVSTAKIADGAITAAKIADGTIVAAEIANNAITTAKIADSNITTAKIAAGAVTAAKLGNDISLTPPDGSITQAKLAASLSGITVTTLAGRSAAVPSPFTGQTIFLSDVTRLQVWDGSAWTFITNGAPGAPTSLNATPLSTTSVSVAFTTGALAGSSITNYKYAYSSDNGSTYTEFAALDPVDTTSPVVISGLTGSTTYLIKLRAVSDLGDSVDSSAVSVTTLTGPSAPTSLSATGFYLAAQISFTPGADGGSAITNYEYALSTNSGATYGSFTALNPADASSPIDIVGLANNTTYSIKIRAVSTAGTGTESSAVSVTTDDRTISYLVVAGGGGGGRSPNVGGGGGGAGGVAVKTNHAITLSTNYALSIGGGGAAYAGYDGGGNNGSSSSGFGNTLNGGGTSGYYNRNVGYQPSTSGGSGGGGAHSYNTAGASVAGTVAAGATFYGNAGGNGGSINSVPGHPGGGGGGAGAVGGTVNFPHPYSGAGGVGISNSLTGSAVFVGGGGGGSSAEGGAAGGNGGGGAGGQGSSYPGTAGTTNTGGGGGGAGPTGYDVGGANPSGAGGSGVIVIQYPATLTMTLGAGLTASHTNTAITVSGLNMKYSRITAGSGNVSWS